MAQRKQFLLPFLVLAVGVGWLLNVAGIVPGVNWLWCGFLAATGLYILLAGRFTRGAFVVGLFLIGASVLDFLRYTGMLLPRWEWPILVVVLGGLLVLAQFVPEQRCKPGSPEKDDGE